MNTRPNQDSKRDEIITAIGLLVLLIGTATGNAIAMLTMAIVTLAVIAVFFRHRIGQKALLTIVAATSVSFAVAMIIANL